MSLVSLCTFIFCFYPHYTLWLGRQSLLPPEDIGEIVFNMIECNLLAKTEQDTRNDFKSVYNFEEAFRKPFLPSIKPTSRPVEPKAA